MGIIKVLPEIIANRIAAGEVIERPASIVKELVENSLDAGTKSIEISIQHGGKSLIRIADDGCGMAPDDAEIAFLRHATSKITAAEDLAHIDSYGFRGEALPSIAAVSRAKLITRSRGASHGTEISMEGGKMVHAKASPCAEGTIMEVRDLFFNTPARRKFLKSDSTELGQVTEIISNIALAQLGVHFIFRASDKTVFNLPPVSDLSQRAAAIFGADTAKHLLEMKGETPGVKIWGVIGKPLAARSNRTGQIFFVNRRWIKAFPFSFALQAGYHGLLMHGQYPAAVVFIDVDLERVDVNVHPTKQEVRISNESQIKSLLKEIVETRLAAEPDLAPQLRHPALGSRTESNQGVDTNYIQESFPEEKNSAAESGDFYPVQDPQELIEPISFRDELHITKVLGQIHGTFIVAETEEGLMIVDQHAAHERVMFETLRKGFETGQPVRQRLLMDEILDFSARHHEILKEAMPLLEKSGFELDDFGENTIVVRAMPAIFENQSPVTVLKTFLEEREDGKLKTGLENRGEEVAALVACKRKSVKAHEPMTAESIKTLLARLSHCENPFCCPHGRPTFLKYTFLDLEKQFKRK